MTDQMKVEHFSSTDELKRKDGMKP